jgi:hypothetical protein
VVTLASGSPLMDQRWSQVPEQAALVARQLADESQTRQDHAEKISRAMSWQR